MATVGEAIGRTPAAVSMKACNFASFDPTHQARGVAGLRNVSRADRELWDEFEAHPTRVAEEIEREWERVIQETSATTETARDQGATESQSIVRVRRVQTFFRNALRAGYSDRCALTGLAVPELLNASHIVPWAEDESRRADPRNGLLLNALHDRAFDRGLMTFDEDHRAVLVPDLRNDDVPEFHSATLIAFEGVRLTPPERFAVDDDALAFHREHIFRG